MGQSISAVFVHYVFSTKGREPILDDAIRPRLHAYLATILRNLGARNPVVGGTADHVHCLCELPRTLTMAKLAEETKKVSSKWVKAQGAGYRSFAWQSGYAVFSVSKSVRAEVVRYIETQAEHHRTRSFQEEYLRFLEAHECSFSPEHLWE